MTLEPTPLSGYVARFIPRAQVINEPQAVFSREALAAYREAGTRAAIVTASARLTKIAGEADAEVGEYLHRRGLQAMADMEAVRERPTSAHGQKTAKEYTEIFTERAAAHNIAFWEGFTEQAVDQVMQPLLSRSAGRLRFSVEF